MVNKRGWIRIVEALVAVLLITGVLLVMINRDNNDSSDLSNKIYSLQLAILREIQLDDSLRDEILSAKEGEINALPIVWKDFESEGLLNIKIRISERIPDYLECEARLCELDNICSIQKDLDKNIYSQSVAIVATKDYYNPRQLKLFCWTKE